MVNELDYGLEIHCSSEKIQQTKLADVTLNLEFSDKQR